jgi:acetyltransferase-like isoleucine patch superfamily enzyme
MSYLNAEQLKKIGFKSLGINVKISDKAAIYDPEKIEIGDNSRVDDFCIISGAVRIGKYCHITPYCLLAGGSPSILIEDFCTLAYGVKVFSQSDDYSGESMTNSLIPKKFKKEIFKQVTIKKHSIIGSNSIIFPGVILEEGTSVGAMSLVNKNTIPWATYHGIPAKKIKARSKNILNLEKKFLEGLNSDSI